MDNSDSTHTLQRVVPEEPTSNGRGVPPPPGSKILPSPFAPMEVARELVREKLCVGENSKLLKVRFWRGGWQRWLDQSHWAEVKQGFIESIAWHYTEHAYYLQPSLLGSAYERWQPNQSKISNLLRALRNICFLDDGVDQPSWLPGEQPVSGHIVACNNGLLHVPTRRLLPHSTSYFNSVAVPFDFEPDAEPPQRWLAFLHSIWPDDPDSIDAIQEWFGYVISGRTDLQKMFLWVSPPRGGKGATARVLGELIGRRNVASPTLDSLATHFGRAGLIGKSLAVVSDARLSAHNSTTAVQPLLTISGEDAVDIDRKYQEVWHGRLSTRFLVLSNELPAFGDASGAIVSRFIILQSSNSWLGKEDPTLEPALAAELPGILNWALDGLTRLEDNGSFTRPESMSDTVVAMVDLASPVAAFVRERCVLSGEIGREDLFIAWKQWADDNGHRVGSAQTFGKNLRAVHAGIRDVRPRDGSTRRRLYAGISLAEH